MPLAGVLGELRATMEKIDAALAEPKGAKP
jgi:hypothetical protein